jgi:hypothetical protein
MGFLCLCYHAINSSIAKTFYVMNGLHDFFFFISYLYEDELSKEAYKCNCLYF